MTERRPTDGLLQTLILLIVAFGLLMLISASSVLSFERYHDSYFLVKRQLFNIVLGLIFLWSLSRYDYRKLRKFGLIALLVSIGLLIAVLIPSVGVRLLGAQRWIALGPINLQPAELTKLALIIYLATWLDHRRLGGREGQTHLRTFLTLLAVTGGLIILQPDLGTLLVISGIAVAMYFVSGAPYRQLGIIFGVAFVAMLLAIVIAPYRLSRLTVFLNPRADTQGQAYHINQSLIAIGSGGLQGVGLGHSRQKFNYLPEAAGDSIFSIIAEEMGFVVAIGFLSLYVAVVLRGYRIAVGIADTFGKTLAVGITSWIAIQTSLNIGALSGVLPLTGVPLPLVSYGGSSLIFLLSAIGILLNISRHAKVSRV